ncbi:MAG: hypothetical protein AAF483_27275, partial [Planctomycetota bacterium]
PRQMLFVFCFCCGLALLASTVAAASFLIAFRTATVFAAISATALLFAAVLGASRGGLDFSLAASILAAVSAATLFFAAITRAGGCFVCSTAAVLTALSTTALFLAAITSAGCGSFSRSRVIALGSLLRHFLAANHSNKQGA